MKKNHLNLISFLFACAITYGSFAQKTVEVSASSNWTPTGFIRQAGDFVIICANGATTAWSAPNLECWQWFSPSGYGRPNFNSPANPCSDCPSMSLIGKIGTTGTPFYIGSRGVVQANDFATGEIFLMINDATPLDNQGKLDVVLSNTCSEIENCHLTHSDSSPGTVKINAIDDWMPTGISRAAGETVHFCANGLTTAWNIPSTLDCWQWFTASGYGRTNYNTPSNPCSDCPSMSLIGKIGINGVPFFIGEQGILRNNDTQTGEIYLRVNDEGNLNNQGSLDVVIAKSCTEIEDCQKKHFELVSAIEPIGRAELRNDRFSIFPNPTSGSLWIAAEELSSEKINIQIFSPDGVIMTNLTNIDFQSENLSFPINTESLPKVPFVWIKISTAFGVNTQKVILDPR